MTKIILSALLAFFLFGTSQAIDQPQNLIASNKKLPNIKIAFQKPISLDSQSLSQNINTNQNYNPTPINLVQNMNQNLSQAPIISKSQPLLKRETQVLPKISSSMIILPPGQTLTLPKQPQWSYLIGISSACAKKVINNQRPQLKVQIIKSGVPITSDFRTDRVRLFVDQKNNVKQKPYIG